MPKFCAVNQSKVQALFTQYRAEGAEDVIMSEGIERLCNDIEVSTLDPVTLSLCFHMNAKQMGVFTREEFVTGLTSLNVDSVEKLKLVIPTLRADLADPTECKKVYAFTFGFALDQFQKHLPMGLAAEFWKLLLKPHFALLVDWIAFVEANHAESSLRRDDWMMIFDLATMVKPDLSNYDDEPAWPVMLDNFVEHVRSQRKA